MSSDRRPTRRRVLSVVGVGAVATVAGCTGRTATAPAEGTGSDLSLLMMSAPRQAVIGKPHTITAKLRNDDRRSTDLRTALERRTPGREWSTLESIERTVPAAETVTVARDVVFDEQLTTWQYRLDGFDATVAVQSRLDCGCKREGQPLLDDETTDGDESDEEDGDAGRVSPLDEQVRPSREPAGRVTAGRREGR